MLNNIEKVLISEAEIAEKVAEIGAQISKDYEGKNLMLVSVLKGSVLFMADLMRAITIPCTIDFMAASSYGGGVKTTGVVKITKDLDKSLEGIDVLLVEDILDSGLTLSYITKHIAAKGARSIKIATLLDKPERRQVNTVADYKCFEVPDEFVVGYGLDFDQYYRNVPFVGVLKPSAYEK